jgi:nucleolar protein 56
MPQQYVLFESASGYTLFEVVESEEIAKLKAEVQASVTDLARFSKLVKLTAFQPYTSAENALQNINDVSEGIVNEDLKNFLEAQMPKVKPGKTAKFVLGVMEPKIGQAIQDGLAIPCNSNDTILELARGIRAHFDKYVAALAGGNLEKAQLGLAHSYSRAKVKFNVNRVDNMIIQSISLLDQLDKDLNTFAMRVREWYSWHFPELARIVKDNFMYARCAKFIGARTTLNESKLEELAKITMDEDLARAVLEASRVSMGMDISEIDLANVEHFTTRLVSLSQYRQQLHEYLNSKMQSVAPNLGALIGEVVGARLISHAGSLTNLAKAPASTVQILGAEKALFRALKTKGNTPKYGLIFHSSFIGRAAAKNKGRISRYLANKCAIAARIDAFSDKLTSKFGEKLKEQVEDRLAFYDTGAAPKRNVDVMHGVMADLAEEEGGDETAAANGASSGKKAKKEKKEKKAKRKASEMEGSDAEDDEEAARSAKKKAKKAKKADSDDE